MSFLDNSRTVGTAFFVVGALEIILAIVMIILGFMKIEFTMGGSTYAVNTIVAVISGIGSILCGCVYIGFGKDIRAGVVTSKWDIFTRFVLTTAICCALNAIFGAVADGADNINIGSWVVNAIIGLIFAAIIYFVYTKITDGQATTFDKILWVLILIVLIIGLLINIVSCLAFPIGTIMGICGVLIDIFMLIALFDPEVKSKMGM